MAASPKKARRKATPLVEKMTTSMRLPVGLKERLDDAAKASGRSLTQEVELRIEQSFKQQDLLPELLALAYGRETAGLLFALAAVLVAVGREAAFTKGGLKGASSWFDEPYAFDQALNAVRGMLEALRPHGDTIAPQFDWMNSVFKMEGDVVGALKRNETERAANHVEEMIKAVAGESQKQIFKEDAARIRSLSSKMVERLSTFRNAGDPS